MNPTVSAVVFGLLMVLALVVGVIYAFRIWRSDPQDILRSTRLKHLAYAIFGVWLLALVPAVFVMSAGTPGMPLLILMTTLYFGLPLVAAGVRVMAFYAHLGEQRASRAEQEALGLAVEPRRIAPATLATWYGIGLFTVVPVVATGVLLAIAAMFGDSFNDGWRAAAIWTVLGAVGLIYVATATVHIVRQRWRVSREADTARQHNLGVTEPRQGSTEGGSPQR